MITKVRGTVTSTGAIGVEIPVSGRWRIKNIDFGMITKTNVYGKMAISIINQGNETYLVNGHQISQMNPSVNISTDLVLTTGDRILGYITGANAGNVVELDVYVEGKT